MKTYPRHQYPLMIAIIHVLAVVGKRYVCQYNTLVKPTPLQLNRIEFQLHLVRPSTFGGVLVHTIFRQVSPATYVVPVQ